MLLETKDLTKKFKRGKKEFFAVKDMNIGIESGEFVSIVGKSGIGKTTFVNMIAAILEPTSGDILFNNRSILNMDDEKASSYRNEYIGYLPQFIGTLPNLSVADNIRLPYFLRERSFDVDSRAEKIMKELGIYDLRNQMPNSLSGGERKRVLLARSIINKPKLLIVDEPTSDLDPQTTIEVMNILKKINREENITVISITHDIDNLKYGDRVIEMG